MEQIKAATLSTAGAIQDIELSLSDSVSTSLEFATWDKLDLTNDLSTRNVLDEQTKFYRDYNFKTYFCPHFLSKFQPIYYHMILAHIVNLYFSPFINPYFSPYFFPIILAHLLSYHFSPYFLINMLAHLLSYYFGTYC